ncbi:ribosomal protein L10 [Hamiltosporidium tvaerminnensis]|nr:ribosomal protein L10 [Hamiltosporidium magnivora]TBU03057.1 ribosomal protein L10 [Hamiltosporidium tvaerminnensis]TBU13682.1 ribosomal protein L10 [Hamiltosporidium tvaerminnensis]
MIDEALKTTSSEEDTFEVQIALKGYDYNKDVRFDSNVVLPHPKRKNEKILIIADKTLEQKAVSLSLPFVNYESVQGASKERQKLKGKLCRRSHSLIAESTFNKAFEMRIINRKRKPLFIIKNVGDLQNFYNDVSKTVKFKLRKENTLSFPAGYAEMGSEKIVENVYLGLTHLLGLLKKGMRNIDSIFIKTAKGKPVKVH